jgi:hypothetical protein
MRCPDCSKFVSYDGSEEPEVNTYDVDENGSVQVEVRIHKDCADCSTELKEYTFELTGDVPDEFIEAHSGDDHELEVSEVNAEGTERQDNPNSPLRYRKTYYGVEAEVIISCSCGESCTLMLTEEVPAGVMDELT